MLKKKNVLPKSWKHWCRKNGLTIHAHRKNVKEQWAWYSLKGRGHYWRITCYNTLERGDNYQDFDRWALCENIFSGQIPQTQKEFSEFVKKALSL